MRGLIHFGCPPRESVLQAAEREMCIALADSIAARKRGDTAGEAAALARLHQLVEQAVELVRRAA